jgi:hypothetical protein
MASKRWSLDFGGKASPQSPEFLGGKRPARPYRREIVPEIVLFWRSIATNSAHCFAAMEYLSGAP